MDKILILGGTNFIGRNLVDCILKFDNYDITLFNRGQTNPEIYLEINKICGDRNTSDINQISNKKWDYIIDLSCYFPDSLDNILKMIKNPPKRYIFISTCSVYDNNICQSILKDENSATLNCNAAERIDSSAATYGNRKAECERILKQSGLRYSILRPSLVYGPYDSTDRLYYWLYQIKKGNKLLIPNQGKSKFSVTYVKDLVQVILKLLNTNNESNIYNVTTYPQLSISELVNTASQILGKIATLQYADPIFLREHNISQWTDLPLWLDCDYFTFDNKKLLNELEMHMTEFSYTVSSTIAYYESLFWQEPKYGMNEHLKNELIDKLMKIKNT